MDRRNWVERRKTTEVNLARDSESLWRDIRIALEDAAESLKELYKQEAEVTSLNAHRIRVKILQNAGASKITEIDVFLKANGRIEVSFLGNQKPSVLFGLAADHDAAFIVNFQGERLNADEVSQRILEPIFFGNV